MFLLLLASCGWKFDPSSPYPDLQVGDYWIDKFDQRGLQHAKVTSDKLFCNTINITKGQNYLYCLSLSTGKVLWKVPVETYASQGVEIHGGQLYFCTYVGDLYKISMEGEVLWKMKCPFPYAGHKVNPINGNVIVNSVVNGAYEFDANTGRDIHHYRLTSQNRLCSLTEPLFYQNQIVFGNAEMDSPHSGLGFVGLAGDSKKVLWQSPLPKEVIRRQEQGIFAIDKHLLALDRNHQLHCIDMETGEKKWVRNLLDDRASQKWVFRFQAQADQFIYHKGEAIALDIESGEEIPYRPKEILTEYDIRRGDELYRIRIKKEVQISGLNIQIEKMSSYHKPSMETQ